MRSATPALLAALAVALPACGGGGGGEGDATGKLRWTAEPVLIQAPRLPRDRIVVGTVRNDSLRRIVLEAADLRVTAGGGIALRSQSQFAAAYAHGLYGADYRPKVPPEEERRRLGLVVTLDPGETAPLTVAYRLRAGARAPIGIDYGAGTLPVPRQVRRP